MKISRFERIVARQSGELIGAQKIIKGNKKNSQRDDTTLQEKLLELAQKHPDDGRLAMVWRLRTRRGRTYNHKRIGRVYRELNLQVGRRKRKKSRPARGFPEVIICDNAKAKVTV